MIFDTLLDINSSIIKQVAYITHQLLLKFLINLSKTLLYLSFSVQHSLLMQSELANLPIFQLSLDQDTIRVARNEQLCMVCASPCFGADQLSLRVEVEHWGEKRLRAPKVKCAKHCKCA
jgi:hypothetical protein